MSFRIRSQKDLEIKLQGLHKPDSFNNSLEQYPTDPALAAHVAVTAYLDGNISGKSIADLGCGFGVLACAAAMLGASHVVAIEIDPLQASMAVQNCREYQVSVVNSDIYEMKERVDTTLMNPPFGSVNPHSDQIFLSRAVEFSSHVYSIHNKKSSDFVREFLSAHGKIKREEAVSLLVPRMYSHHTRDYMRIPAVFFSTDVS